MRDTTYKEAFLLATWPLLYVIPVAVAAFIVVGLVLTVF